MQEKNRIFGAKSQNHLLAVRRIFLMIDNRGTLEPVQRMAGEGETVEELFPSPVKKDGPVPVLPGETNGIKQTV